MNERVTSTNRKNTPSYHFPASGWRRLQNTYCYKVYLLADAEGFSVEAAMIPDVTARGTTEQEALDNMIKAFQAAAEVFKAKNESLPRREAPKTPAKGAVNRWVTVRL